MLTIKRYKNRKLYDTNQSRYVTLDDILSLMLKEVPFRVLDHKSEDITSQTVFAAMSTVMADKMDLASIKTIIMQNRHLFENKLSDLQKAEAQPKINQVNKPLPVGNVADFS